MTAAKPRSRTRPAIPPPPLGAIFRNTLADVTRLAGEILALEGDPNAMPPSVVAQVGTAGLVAELALHPHQLEKASALANFTAQTAGKIEMPVGLLYGRMGTALAVQAAARAANDPRLHLASQQLLPRQADLEKERRADVSHGVAGLGIGYLAFASSAQNSALPLALAHQCARRIIDDAAEVEQQLRMLPLGNPSHAISIADGFAHGRAGIAYFLLAHAARSGDERSRRAARALLDALAAVVPGLASGAASSKARPMAASWCQGLAGIGTTLARGAYFFDDRRYLSAACQAADGCLAISARIALVTQCCGLAGVGEFLLDLGLITRNPAYRRHALGILDLMLARSGGSPTAPRFPGSSLSDDAPGWGTGTTGVLSFLRRLIDPATPRHWLADTGQLLPLAYDSR
jgi:hypothetical protein